MAQSNRKIVAATVLWLLAAGTVNAEQFSGSNVGEIPDIEPIGRTISFDVTGIDQPLDEVRVALSIDHTGVGDLTATLKSPDGVARLVLFGRTGLKRGGLGGFYTNLEGTYTFDDSAQQDWWLKAQETQSGTMPPGHYRTNTHGTRLSNHGGCSTSLAGAFAGLSGDQVNGVWTLHIADVYEDGFGSIDSAVLTLVDDKLLESGFDPSIRGSCTRAQFDFLGVGRTSYAVARLQQGGPGQPSPVLWSIALLNSDGSPSGTNDEFVFGDVSEGSGLSVIPGDYDGDGITDIAVRRTATGEFLVRRSSRPTDTPLSVVFGAPGDDPNQSGDYDGDGIDDFAVYQKDWAPNEPSRILVRLSGGGPDRSILISQTSTDPNSERAFAGADYTGDGRADVASVADDGLGAASFSLQDGTTGALITNFLFGTYESFIVMGNHAGSGLYDITTVIEGGKGGWNWTTRDTATGAVLPTLGWGLASVSDFVLTGDYDGDGLDDLAVWNPTTASYRIRQSSNPMVPLVVPFGQSGDFLISSARVY